MKHFCVYTGGTGARCAEAFAYLSACGLLGSHPVEVLLLDADQSNGNLTHAEEVLRRYGMLQRSLSRGREQAADRFLQKPIASDKWIVNLNDNTGFHLRELAQTPDGRVDPAADRLMQALYTPTERERLITSVGFFAHPNVGAAVMRAVLLKEEDGEQEESQSIYGRLRRKIQTALGAGEEVRVFLTGSVFGGTGASAIPAIAKDLLRIAADMPGARERLRIGAALMLPYFAIAVPVKKEGQIHSERFAAASRTALEYYRGEGSRLFDHAYIMGSPTPVLLENKGTGGGKQENPPMLVEWEAALAAGHFFGAQDMRGATPQNHIKWMDYTVPQERMVARWADLSMPEAGRAVAGLMNFAGFYLYYYHPEIVRMLTNPKPPNWYTLYVKEAHASEEGKQVIDQLRLFLEGFIGWLGASVGSDEVDQFMVQSAPMERLMQGAGSVEEAVAAVASGERPVRPKKVYTAIHQGGGSPLTLQTFIHHLYAVAQNEA